MRGENKGTSTSQEQKQAQNKEQTEEQHLTIRHAGRPAECGKPNALHHPQNIHFDWWYEPPPNGICLCQERGQRRAWCATTAPGGCGAGTVPIPGRWGSANLGQPKIRETP